MFFCWNVEKRFCRGQVRSPGVICFGWNLGYVNLISEVISVNYKSLWWKNLNVNISEISGVFFIELFRSMAVFSNEVLLFEFDLSICWAWVLFNSEMFFLKYSAPQNNRKYLNFSKKVSKLSVIFDLS